jgi:hypothetical protein
LQFIVLPVAEVFCAPENPHFMLEFRHDLPLVMWGVNAAHFISLSSFHGSVDTAPYA